jgi:hypothetical protein
MRQIAQRDPQLASGIKQFERHGTLLDDYKVDASLRDSNHSGHGVTGLLFHDHSTAKSISHLENEREHASLVENRGGEPRGHAGEPRGHTILSGDNRRLAFFGS